MIDLDSATATVSPRMLRDLAADLGRQPRSIISALIAALRPVGERSGTALPASVWGRSPSVRARRAAAAENLALGVSRRREVIAASETRASVAASLGKSEQAVSAMLDRGALLGLKEGREWRIPTWQLDPNLASGVLPGVGDVARAYADGIVSLSGWIERPNPDLDGKTPRDVLARGGVGEVVAAATAE